MADIVCPLHEAAQVTPHFPAVTDGEERLNYQQFNEQVLHMQAGFQARGVGAGDRVGILMPVNGSYLAALVALWRLHAVACPLNDKAPVAVLAEQAQELDLKGIVCEELSAEIPVPEFFTGELLGADVPPKGEIPKYDLSAVATIIYTSGSSSKPKAAVHRIQAHYYSALGANRNLRLKPHDIWALSLPLYHVGGLAILWRCLLSGSCMGLPVVTMRLPDQMKFQGVTHASMVSTQLRELIEHPEVEEIAEKLEGVLVGGGPQSEGLLKQAVMQGIPVLPTYGCTEMASQVTTMPPHAFARKSSTSGKALSYRVVSLAGDGEILLRGETLCEGYLEAGSIASITDVEGWFHSGDLGRLDDEDFLTVTGRKDRMFISGGENIQPEEIEAALMAQPHVDLAAVIAVDDEKFGQRPLAFVRGEVDEEALAQRLPKYKLPVRFKPLPDEAVQGLKVNYRVLEFP